MSPPLLMSEESFPALAPRPQPPHQEAPALAHTSAPPATSPHPSPVTHVATPPQPPAPVSPPPGSLVVTKEVMMGLPEWFARIIASALNTIAEPRVFADSAKEVARSLFPEAQPAE